MHYSFCTQLRHLKVANSMQSAVTDGLLHLQYNTSAQQIALYCWNAATMMQNKLSSRRLLCLPSWQCATKRIRRHARPQKLHSVCAVPVDEHLVEPGLILCWIDNALDHMATAS